MEVALIRTKYCRPAVGKYFIPRPRLSRKLEETAGVSLTAVTAPAGFGKTTAVLDWLEKTDRTAATTTP